MNPFDQNLGYYNAYDELNGIGSKLKKAVKKVDQSAKKVRQKTLPSKLNKATSKAAKNPVVRAVAATAAVAFAGPLVLAALSNTVAGAAIAGKVGAALSAKGIAGTAAKVALTAAKTVASNKIVSPQVEKFATKKIQAQTVKLANSEPIKDGAKEAMTEFVAVAQNPDFNNTVKTLAAQGKTPEQITEIWKASDAYKETVTNAAQAITAPIVYQEAVNQGAPIDVADAVAQGAGLKAAETAVNKVDAGSMLKIAAIGIPLALALLG